MKQKGLVLLPALIFLSAAAGAFTTGETLYSVHASREAALSGAGPGSLYPQMDSFFNSENLSVTNGELEWDTSARRIDYARPGKIAMGVSIIQFQSASADVLDELNNSGGSFRETQTLLRLSGASSSEHLFGALSFDYIKHSIFGFSAGAGGFGAAAGWAPFGRKVLRKERVYLPLNVGFAVQNISASALETGLESEELPLNTHLFFNSNLFAGALCLYLKKSVMDSGVRGEARTAMGLELRISDELVVRGGKDDFAASYGAGATLGRFFLDVAAINGESGSRMMLSAGFKFSYIASLAEQIIAEKEEKIKKMAKELDVLKDSSGAMTDEEREWLLKMLAQVQKDITMRDFSKAAAGISTILARYEDLLNKEAVKLTKTEARKLAGKARALMEQGNYPEAKKLILEALNVLRGDVSVEEISYLIDAYAAVAEGNYALARAVLAEGIIVHPGSSEMIRLMKRIDKFMGIVKEAEK